MNDDVVDNSVSGYEAYLEERKMTIEAEHAQSLLFDKSLITISSAAFGLSIAFFRFVVNSPATWTLVILASSWFFLGLSMCLTMKSFLVSQDSHARYREILDKKQMGEFDDGINHFSEHVSDLNNNAFWSLFLGLSMLGAFCITNVFLTDAAQHEPPGIQETKPAK